MIEKFIMLTLNWYIISDKDITTSRILFCFKDRYNCRAICYKTGNGKYEK